MIVICQWKPLMMNYKCCCMKHEQISYHCNHTVVVHVDMRRAALITSRWLQAYHGQWSRHHGHWQRGGTSWNILAAKPISMDLILNMPKR